MAHLFFVSWKIQVLRSLSSRNCRTACVAGFGPPFQRPKGADVQTATVFSSAGAAWLECTTERRSPDIAAEMVEVLNFVRHLQHFSTQIHSQLLWIYCSFDSFILATSPRFWGVTLLANALPSFQKQCQEITVAWQLGDGLPDLLPAHGLVVVLSFIWYMHIYACIYTIYAILHILPRFETQFDCGHIHRLGLGPLFLRKKGGKLRRRGWGTCNFSNLDSNSRKKNDPKSATLGLKSVQ